MIALVATCLLFGSCDTVTHTRTVVFVKDCAAPYFIVTDELRAKDDKPHAAVITAEFRPEKAK